LEVDVISSLENKEYIDECYNNVVTEFNTSGEIDLVNFWISHRSKYLSELGQAIYEELNYKIIKDHGQRVNS
jgi:hypothetical protein